MAQLREGLCLLLGQEQIGLRWLVPVKGVNWACAALLEPSHPQMLLFPYFWGLVELFWIFFTEFLSLACPVPWERLLGLFFGLCLTWKVLRSRAARSWELPAQWVPELVPKPNLIYLIVSE